MTTIIWSSILPLISKRWFTTFFLLWRKMPESDAQECDECAGTLLHIQVNMVLNVHRNRKAYKGWRGVRGREVREREII